MRAIVNKYAKSCLTCQTLVAVGDGVSIQVDDRWSTYCRDHAPMQPYGSRDAGKPTDPTIELRWLDGAVQIRPVDYLGGDLFQTYLTACGGAEYKKAIRANVAGPELVGGIVTRLAAAGFNIDASPEVTAAVQAWEARAKADEIAATGRAAEIDAALRERGLALFPFQAEGVNWLAPRSQALLSDEMGLGKTLQALISAPSGSPILVVCPKVAKGVWLREATRWRPDLRVSVLSGRGSFRWPVAGELVVTNYELLPELDLLTEKDRKEYTRQIANLAKAIEIRFDARDTEELHRLSAEIAADDEKRSILAACPRNLTMIADEAHVLKGGGGKRGTKRGKAFKALCDHAREQGGRGWLVSGSPLLNRPSELWNLLTMIGGQAVVFGSYAKFKALCGAVDGKFGTTWAAGGIDPSVATRLREMMLRRLKSDVLRDLPEKIVEIVDVELDPATIKALDKIRAELEARGIDLDEAIRGAKSNTSIAFAEVAKARAILATAKTAFAMELADELDDAGEPAIVFSAHRDPIAVFEARPGWAVITGDTKDADRTAIAEKFQRGELKGVAGTIQAMGVAVTLTRSSNVVFIDTMWVPELNRQAEDRAHRIGSSRTVNVTYIRANHPIDHRVYELCSVKRSMIARTVDAAAIKQGEIAERVNAADALAGSLASKDSGQRKIDAEAMADRVRAARSQAEADRTRLKAALKSEQAATNRGWNISPEEFATPEREAQTAAEIWAVSALGQLASMDGDYANDLNGIGFSQADTFLGHSIAPAAAAGMLSDGGWKVAIRLAQRYPRQVGEAPE